MNMYYTISNSKTNLIASANRCKVILVFYSRLQLTVGFPLGLRLSYNLKISRSTTII